jgi:hypothetical protein
MRFEESVTLMDSAASGQMDAWVTRSPAAEAQDLYRMVRYGNCTIASIRDLIAVPANIENVLMAYAHAHPEDAGRISRVLRFRLEVRREFDLLVEPLAMFSPEPTDVEPADVEMTAEMTAA